MKRKFLLAFLIMAALLMLLSNQSAQAAPSISDGMVERITIPFNQNETPIIESDASFDEILQALDQVYNQHGTTVAGAKPPIVFVHGWLGLDGTASCQRQNNAYVDGYWQSMDENFNSENPTVTEKRPDNSSYNRSWVSYGFNISIARLKSGGAGLLNPTVPDCTPIAEVNVPNLIEAIDEAKTNSGQDKVIIVAHSMGGLVTRAYLEGSSYRDDVVAAFTLGTPHVGVPISVLQGMLEFITFGALTLADFCISQPVVCQFADDESDGGFPSGFTGIETFNATHNNRADGVYYHMLGGDAGFSQRGWLGAAMDAFLTGPDDGIVPQPSALGQTSADGRLAPLTGPIDRLALNPTLHVESFTDDPTCLVGTGDYVQRHHGFFAQDQWSVRNTCAINTGLIVYRFIPSKSFLNCLSPTIQSRTNNHVCGSVTSLLTAPETAKQSADPVVKFPSVTGSINHGEIKQYELWLNEGEAMFSVNGNINVYDGSEGGLTMRMISPDGTVYDQEYMLTNQTAGNFKARNNAALFWFDNVIPGKWTIEIEGTAPPTKTGLTDTQFILTGFYNSGVEMDGHTDQAYYQAGEKALIRATMNGATPDATIIASIQAGEHNMLVPLIHKGNGVYESSFTVPSNFAGYAQIEYHASGKNLNGYPFTQEKLHLFQIASDAATLTHNYTASIQSSLSGKSLYHDLAVDVQLAVKESGWFGVSADLVDAKGNVIAQTSAFDELSETQNSLTLRFRGKSIIEANSHAPYTVTNLRLLDGQHGGSMMAEATNVLTTSYTSDQLLASTKLIPASSPATDWAAKQTAANTFANHTCTSIDNLGPYNPGETINITFSVDKVVTAYGEWFDYYFTNGPDGWNVTSQSAAPSDVSSWNRPTGTTGCNATGVGYWGVTNPYLDPVPNECELALTNLPTSGSFAGPWSSYEWYDIWTQDFESTTFPPTGWAHWKEDSTSGSGWVRNTSQSHSGSASAYHPNAESCWFGICDWPETWLRTNQLPVMQPGDLLTYWHRSGSSFESNDVLDVYFNTINSKSDSWQEFNDNASDLGDDDYNIDDWRPADPGTSWNKITFNMSDYAGHDQVYFAHYYYANENVWVDDMAIERKRVAPSNHSFSISYVVDNDPATMCPGSNFVGVSSLIDDARSGLAGVAMGDLVDYSLSSAGCSVAQACPLPAVTYDLTVSSNGVCPGLPTVSVPQDAQDITFCYSMTNSSPDVTVTTHTYTNDLAPNSGTTLSIAPLATVLYSETVNLGLAEGNYTNNSNWLAATNIGLGQLQGNGANSYYTDTSYTNAAADSVAIEITPPSCAAPNDPINLVPLLSGVNVDLAWDVVIGADHYEVWWNSSPYAGATGPDCAAALNCSVEPVATFTHPSGAGDSATNYFYTIFAGMGCGSTSTNPANEVGEFDFSIIPGA